MKKRIISLLMAFVLCLMPFGVAFANNSYTPFTPEIPDGVGNADGGLTSTVNTVLGIIKWVAYAVAIVMVMYVGVKYLTAGAGVKAEAKSTLVPMLIGAILVALAPTLVQWIFNALG